MDVLKQSQHSSISWFILLSFAQLLAMLIGVGKSKVVFKKLQLPMFGYGRLEHIAESIENDLFARAFIFRIADKTVALVNLECFIITHHLHHSLYQL